MISNGSFSMKEEKSFPFKNVFSYRWPKAEMLALNAPGPVKHLTNSFVYNRYVNDLGINLELFVGQV